MNHLFGFPVKTFEPENLLKEMLSARDGEMFVLGEKYTKNHEGRSTLKLIMARIVIAEDSHREEGPHDVKENKSI